MNICQVYLFIFEFDMDLAIIENSRMKSITDVYNALLAHLEVKTADVHRSTGISQPTLSRIESGKTITPDMSIQKKLASYFGVSISQLNGEEPIPWLGMKGENGLSPYEAQLCTWVYYISSEISEFEVETNTKLDDNSRLNWLKLAYKDLRNKQIPTTEAQKISYRKDIRKYYGQVI